MISIYTGKADLGDDISLDYRKDEKKPLSLQKFPTPTQSFTGEETGVLRD